MLNQLIQANASLTDIKSALDLLKDQALMEELNGSDLTQRPLHVALAHGSARDIIALLLAYDSEITVLGTSWNKYLMNIKSYLIMKQAV